MHGHQLTRPEAPVSALVVEARAAASGLWEDRDERARLEAIAVKLIQERNSFQARPRKQPRMAI